MDAEGMRLDALERIIARHRPSLVYTVTAFHNPTGTTMSPDRRRGLLALARNHDLLVLEDGVCSELIYEGSLPPPLKALDEGKRVVYVNSFSKFLLPGIRVGYMVASGRILERLVAAKRATDLFTSSLLQRALCDYLEQGHLQLHLEQLRAAYRERRDAMLDAIARHLPGGTSWTRPSGGLCLWVTLPASIDTGQLYLTAIDHGVAFAVGAVFFPRNPTSSSLRLNFAAHPVDRIQEGLRRLGNAIREEQSRTSAVEELGPLAVQAHMPTRKGQ
jgi:DNA-binding transcriptional MocR family regulator